MKGGVAAEEIAGDFRDPRTGIFLAIPVGHVRALQKRE